MRDAERAGIFQPGEVKAQGDLIQVHKHLMGEVKKTQPRASCLRDPCSEQQVGLYVLQRYLSASTVL